MARTVIALYDDFNSASNAIEGLIGRGFIRESIGFVSNDVRGEHAATLNPDPTSTLNQAVDKEKKAQLNDLKRALINLKLMEISGTGPIVAAGPITTPLTASSELMRSLITLGIPEQSAHYYAEGVRRGGTIVVMEVSHEATQDAIKILNEHRPVDMKKRVAHWQDVGWSEYNPEAEPLREEQLWPREKYRQADEKADTEAEEQLWPREEYRQADEKADTEAEEQLWPREEYRQADEKADTEKEEQLWPREKYRHPTSLAEGFPTPPGEKPEEVGVPPVADEEQLWPREKYRQLDEKAATEDERQLWPREQYRAPEEKVAAEKDREIYPRDQYRSPDETAETEEEKVIYPRGEYRTQEKATRSSGDFNSYESTFRRHFDANVSEPGATFDQYRPAYRYGYNLAMSERFEKNNKWDEIEPAARRFWEDRNPGTWDHYKDSVRKAWEEVKGLRVQSRNG